MGVIDPFGKKQQDAGHQQEYGNQAENNRLHQHNTHVIAQPELHEHHGHHT